MSYLAPDNINGLNLYAYCSNNPVMNVDPSGTFLLSAILIGMLVGAVVGGVVGGVTAAMNGENVWVGIGLGIGIGTLFGLGIGLGSALIVGGGLASVLGAFILSGTINNLINFVYYTYISDGVSDLTSTSYSGTNGDSVKYLSRWDRLDYVKAQTGEKWYNLNAWRYYSEYNVHMYAWMLTSSFYTGNKGDGWISDIAYRARQADILNNKCDSDPMVFIATLVFGALGI